MKYFGTIINDKYSTGKIIRIGRWHCKVLFRIGHWHFVKREER